MSHSKIAFLILILAVCVASAAIADEPKNSRFRYLPPLSTNLKPDELKNADDQKIEAPEHAIYMREENPENENDDFRVFLDRSREAIEYFRESKQKAREIERELSKQRRHREQELKKFLAEIDREHKKHIVEIEREQRKLLQEIEREYKKNMKKVD